MDSQRHFSSYIPATLIFNLRCPNIIQEQSCVLTTVEHIQFISIHQIIIYCEHKVRSFICSICRISLIHIQLPVEYHVPVHLVTLQYTRPCVLHCTFNPAKCQKFNQVYNFVPSHPVMRNCLNKHLVLFQHTRSCNLDL